MDKTDKEIAAEIAASAMANGLLKVRGDSGTSLGSDVASLYKKIYEAVAGTSGNSTSTKK